MLPKIFVSALLSVLCVAAFSQKAEQLIKQNFDEYPQEKVVLTLSKNEFVAGETIYFKAYVLNGYEPSIISTNVYAEIYDKNRKLVLKDLFPLTRGIGDGSFQLPAYLAEDVYFIRAYTRWMLNFDESLIYLQPVRIYNPNSSQKLMAKPVEWDAAVFPESGTLLQNVPNRVAIRLQALGMLPETWQVELFEKISNKKITATTSLNKQVALLEFTPAMGVEYFVKITDNTGTTKEVSLPAVQAEGAIVRVRADKGKINYRLHIQNPSRGEGYKLVGIFYDQQIFSAAIKRSSGIVDGVIETKNFPNGILQLVLLDEREDVVASRLTFIDHQDMKIHQPELHTDTLQAEPKSVNSWQLPVDTLRWYSYSLQIEDAVIPEVNDFLPGLYLTADFPQGIVDPSWYFYDIDDKKAQALNALLITETWKRLSVKNLMNNQFPSIKYIPENYLTYKATVTRSKKPEPLQEVNLIMQTKDSVNHFVNVTTDKNGMFLMDDFLFQDTVKLIYQLNSKKNSARRIDIKFESLNTFSPLKSPLPATAYTLQPRQRNDPVPAHIARASDAINNKRIADERYKMMQEVIISYRKKNASQELNEKLSTGIFKSINETIFDFVNENQTSAMGYMNILDWLQGRVAGLQVQNMDGVATPMIRGSVVPVFVDEFRVEPEQLFGYSVSDIAMIKVIRGPFLGASGANGAIAIYLRRGGMNTMNNFPGLPFDHIVGYTKQPVFFTPDYNQDMYKDFIDKRQILYRPQYLLPDETGKALIRFYNSDITNSFRITISGFTSEGTPVFLQKIISPALKN